MPKQRQVFNDLLGVWEDETSGQQNIFYQAFHRTGGFDRLKDDPDFMAGKVRVTPRRVILALSVSNTTVDKLDEFVKLYGQNRGRIVDELVEHGLSAFKAALKKRGNGDDQAEG